MIARVVIAFLALSGLIFLMLKVVGGLHHLTLGQMLALAKYVVLTLVSVALAAIAVYSIIQLETLF